MVRLVTNEVASEESPVLNIHQRCLAPYNVCLSIIRVLLIAHRSPMQSTGPRRIQLKYMRLEDPIKTSENCFKTNGAQRLTQEE